MKQRRRIYDSSAQRSEIWDRWQAGESMSSIGRRLIRRFGSAPNRRSASVNGRRFPEGSARNVRCDRLLGNRDDLHRRSAVKSVAMVAWIAIGLPGPIKPPGIGRCVPSFARWLAVRS